MVRNLQRIDAPAFIGRRPISLRLRLGSRENFEGEGPSIII